MVIWGVSEVTRHVKEVIESDLALRDLWVEGEVSNFSISMAGHAFFTLKDAASQLRCVMFRPYVQRMRVRPSNGERGVARGPVRVYEAQGVYQLYAEFLAPAGLGEAQLRLEELLQRLEAEGLFDESRKRPLPAWPRRIGVVTSATGAVIHDIRTVIGRRFPLVELILAPTPVQGDEAAPRICTAIDDLNRVGVDVIIVARGGGSQEDLAAFNEESVARAVFGSGAPVVSAIGHETDTTVVDLVADRRAPTPSAAAELVVPDVREIRSQLDRYAERLGRSITLVLRQATEQVSACAEDLARLSPREDLTRRRRAVDALLARASLAARNRCALEALRLRAGEAQLASLNPLAVLKRGYSLTWEVESGTILRSVAAVAEGTCVRTRLLDGTFDSRVLAAGHSPHRDGAAAAHADRDGTSGVFSQPDAG